MRVFNGRWAGAFAKGARSSFMATPLLFDALNSIGITDDSVWHDVESAPVIVLKGEDDRLVRYDPHDKWVAQQIDELRDYNAFIDAQDISLPGGNGRGRTDLIRFFNDGSWERGGRHFGGWWQTVPSNQRPNILINGEETVELDYGGFFTRALYHLERHNFRGDPYDIPEVRSLFEGQGIDWEAKGRQAVKRIVNIAISAKRKTALSSEKSIRQIALPDDVIQASVPIIMSHHFPIKKHFFKAKSLDLMNLESEICHQIICHGMYDDVVILPIFDSFITTKENEDYLRRMMIEEYRLRLAYLPVIH